MTQRLANYKWFLDEVAGFLSQQTLTNEHEIVQLIELMVKTAVWMLSSCLKLSKVVKKLQAVKSSLEICGANSLPSLERPSKIF